MKITICGSMKFHNEMRDVKRSLEGAGHTVFVPKSIELMDREGYVHPTEDEERIQAKIEPADAILVLN